MPKNRQIIVTLLILLSLTLTCTAQQTDQQKKQRIHNEQLSIREAVNLIYGQNSESLTFSLPTMTDFVVKAPQNEEIKAVIHTFWKQNNVYISSEYREGESIRVLVYLERELSPEIIFDRRFYITSGFKFTAEKDKVYTIRFIDQGKIGKLVALELSKTTAFVDDKLGKQEMENSKTRLANLANELKILSGISQFSIVMSEKNLNSFNDGTNSYLTFIVIEAIIILVIVGVQIKMLLGMLKQNSVI